MKNKEDNNTIDYSTLPPECDVLCEWRGCLQKGENKGSFTPGRGYTSYHKKPQYVCMTRFLHGCPDRDIPDRFKILDSLREKQKALKMSRKVELFVNTLIRIIDKLIVYNEEHHTSK